MEPQDEAGNLGAAGGLPDFRDHFEGRRERAAERMLARGPHQTAWFFGISGLTAPVEVHNWGWAAIRQVVDPPGEVELARALVREERASFGALARYSRGITCELQVPFDGDEQVAFDAAWHAASALRMRADGDFLVPVAATQSWSVIPAVPENTLRARFIEDVPRARQLRGEGRLTAEDLDWIGSHIQAVAQVIQEPRVRLAVDALATHHLENSTRMMVAHLWAGLEAIFGVQHELRFRLSMLIAAILHPPSQERYETYREIKRLYDFRSKAVHGAKLRDSEIEEHVLAVRDILSRILRGIVETGHVPTAQEMELALLTGRQADGRDSV